MTWLVRRVGRSLTTLFVLIAFAFFSLSASGDPAIIKYGPDADYSSIEAFREKWGLNYPLWLQFIHYLDRLIHLNFGLSFETNEPALGMVLNRIPATLSLMIPALFIAMAFGVTAGFFAAMNKGRFVDQLTVLFAVTGLAIPTFLLGIFLMYIFSVVLGWLPPSGYINWTSYLMPVCTIALVHAASFARFTRSAIVEVMEHPMMETAKASGLGKGLVQRVHALPNALLPLITIMALEVGNIIIAAVVVESVFSWAGVGQLLIESVAARDYNVVQTILLLTGLTMIVANLLADISYGLVDPRVRDSRRSNKCKSHVYKFEVQA